MHNPKDAWAWLDDIDKQNQNQQVPPINNTLQVPASGQSQPPAPVKGPQTIGEVAGHIMVGRGVNKGIDAIDDGTASKSLSDLGTKMGISQSSGAAASNGTPIPSGWGTSELQGTPLGPLANPATEETAAVSSQSIWDGLMAWLSSLGGEEAATAVALA